MTHALTSRACPTHCTMPLLALFLIGFGAPAFAADAGRFFVVIGDVRVLNAGGQSLPAVRGSALSEGDTVITGANALAQLRMVDDGRISLRENTEFKLDDYEFEREEPSAGRMFVNLLRGSFRSLTGLIGKRNRSGYRIRTPHATLGVRGTDHETTVLLTPREGFEPGTFDVVFEGRTFMRTPRGQIEISPRQAGYVGASTPVPRVIGIPQFLAVAQRAAVPAPRAAAVTVPAKPSADRGRKKIDENKMLLNPLSGPKRMDSTRTPLAPDAGKLPDANTLRTPLPTPRQGLQPSLQTIPPTLTPRTGLAPAPKLRAPSLTAPSLTIPKPTLKTPTTVSPPTRLEAPTTLRPRPLTTLQNRSTVPN